MNDWEVNFDGLVGPTHNYSGLSFGNVASEVNKGNVSRPREAALFIDGDKDRDEIQLGTADIKQRGPRYMSVGSITRPQRLLGSKGDKACHTNHLARPAGRYPVPAV